MEYCPFCSGSLGSGSKICPHCNKSLELDIYQSIYSPGPSSKINKKAARQLKFKENARYIFPVIFLIIGLVIGAISLFSYSAIHFQTSKTNFENEIRSLNGQIKSDLNRAGAVRDSLQLVINKQDTVIQYLGEQENQLRQIITFSRRLANNSVFTPNSQDQVEFFRRNYLYLNRLYGQNYEELKALDFPVAESYNLLVFPELITE